MRRENRLVVLAALVILLNMVYAGTFQISLDPGKVYAEGNRYIADIYVNLSGNPGPATIIWYVNNVEINQMTVELPFSGKITVALGKPLDTPTEVYAKVILADGTSSCSYTIEYTYDPNYTYNNGWRVRMAGTPYVCLAPPAGELCWTAKIDTTHAVPAPPASPVYSWPDAPVIEQNPAPGSFIKPYVTYVGVINNPCPEDHFQKGYDTVSNPRIISVDARVGDNNYVRFKGTTSIEEGKIKYYFVVWPISCVFRPIPEYLLEQGKVPIVVRVAWECKNPYTGWEQFAEQRTAYYLSVGEQNSTEVNITENTPENNETYELWIERGNGPVTIRDTGLEGNLVYVPVRIEIRSKDVEECKKDFANNETLITVSKDGNVIANTYGTTLVGNADGLCETQVNVPVGRLEDVNSGNLIMLVAELRKPEGGYWVTKLRSNKLFVKIQGKNAEWSKIWAEDQNTENIQEKNTHNIRVSIQSRYKYEYHIEGNTIHLTLFVNFEARDSCHSIRAELKELNCPNCYEVDIIRTYPSGDMVCAQVYRVIHTLSVDIPFDPEEGNVTIRVIDREENQGAPITDDCMILEGKIYRIRRQMDTCLAGECSTEEMNRIRTEYEKLRKEYEEMRCGEMPELPPMKPIMPEPPKKPIPTPPIIERNVEANIDVNAIIGRIGIPKTKIKIREIVKEKNSIRIKTVVKKRILGILPVEIPMDISVEGESIKQNIPWWGKILSIFAV